MRNTARVLPALAVAVATAAAAAAAASASGSAPRLVEAGGVRFPDRAFVLTLTTRTRLDPQRVHVLENGKPVSGLSVVSGVKERHKQFAVVLAIDASNSMHGRPIRAAMAAARAFAANRDPSQPLAVVTFNGDVRVALPFTTDAGAIARTLADVPTLNEGTRIYDALERSLALLKQERVHAGSIVLLSDGSDVGSVAQSPAVTTRLRHNHVRVFTVGLASHAFDPLALQRVAHATEASYSEAKKPRDLMPLFDDLGYRLANQYLLRYRSTAAPGARIRVRVTIGSSTAGTSGYVTPSLPLHTPPPYHPSLGDRLVQSSFLMVLVAFGAAGLLILALTATVKPRRQSLRARMAAFVSLSQPQEVERPKEEDRVSLWGRLGAALGGLQWWSRFKRNLGIAGVGTPPGQIALLTVLAFLMSALLLSMLLGKPLGLLLSLFVLQAPRSFVQAKLARKRKAFAEQLPDNLEVLSSALRAGHSLVGALSVVVDDASEPSASEFRRVIADEQLGVPLEDALDAVVERMDNTDLEQVALVAALQRESGGNLAEILDRVTENIRNRMELRRLVKTLTAQGRMSRWILTLIPVFLALVLSILNPGYLHPLLSHTSGKVLLVMAALMVTAGSLIIRKIVNIKV